MEENNPNEEFDLMDYNGQEKFKERLRKLKGYKIPYGKVENREEIRMETKSRYEVMSDLEQKKRDLIRERESLNDLLLEKEKKLKMLERQKADNIMIIDRQMEDVTLDINNFKAMVVEKKQTITELLKSVEDSLSRFGKLLENKQ